VRASRRDLIAALAGLAAIAGIAIVLRAAEDQPNPTVAALLLLLVVLVTATAARSRVSIAISIAAMLVFDFFLLPPFQGWAISDPENLIAVFVFVAVAIIASQLSAAVRHRAREAAMRNVEAEAAKQRADLASALLASFGHDLRTPVTSVRVAVANLQDVNLLPQERRRQAELALQELDRLTRLFEGILDMARIDALVVRPQRQWVSPADVVDAAVAHAAPALAERKLQVDADGVSEIQLDPRLASTALSHVLENAARYSPSHLPIAVRAWTNPQGVHFAVQDHGPGVDASDMDRLFEPFYRGRKTTHASGTGLGLAITRGLVAAEGGRVWCENVPAGGTQFSIAIPSPVRRLQVDAS
jgi:two-component system sensor histidine kinase KdpD